MIDGVTIKQMDFGMCVVCGVKPATRMPLRMCKKCSDDWQAGTHTEAEKSDVMRLLGFTKKKSGWSV